MKIHRASKIRDDGRVSALCFKRPRAIDLQVASWTINGPLVTCEKCKGLQVKTLPLPGWESLFTGRMPA